MLALKNETGFVLFCCVGDITLTLGLIPFGLSRSTPECDLPAWPFASVFWKQLNVHGESDVGRHWICVCLYRDQHNQAGHTQHLLLAFQLASGSIVCLTLI
jgi:hypothetical protein